MKEYDLVPNGAFATENNDAYLGTWQGVDSDDLSAGVSQRGTKEEGVLLAVARRVFGQDPTCPPKFEERRRKPIIEELNEVLVA